MDLNQEGRILLATQAIKLNQFKSIRAAAISYDLVPRTLERRIHGMTSRRDSIPNSQKLTPTEELAVVRYILDLDLRGFPPDRKLFKKWQTSFSLNATRLQLARTGPRTSLIVVQNSRQSLVANTIIKELSAKI
jgi:hypothetical protein